MLLLRSCHRLMRSGSLRRSPWTKHFKDRPNKHANRSTRLIVMIDLELICNGYKQFIYVLTVFFVRVQAKPKLQVEVIQNELKFKLDGL